MDKQFAELARIAAVSNSRRTLKVWQDVIHTLYSEDEGVVNTADVIANIALERSAVNDNLFHEVLCNLLNKYVSNDDDRVSFKNELYDALVKLGS